MAASGRTLAVATGSRCSKSRYFSTLTKVLKKAGVSLQILRSHSVILPVCEEVTRQM